MFISKEKLSALKEEKLEAERKYIKEYHKNLELFLKISKLEEIIFMLEKKNPANDSAISEEISRLIHENIKYEIENKTLKEKLRLISDNDRKNKNLEHMKEIEEMASGIQEWLKENKNPHTTLVINTSGVTLYEEEFFIPNKNIGD